MDSDDAVELYSVRPKRKAVFAILSDSDDNSDEDHGEQTLGELASQWKSEGKARKKNKQDEKENEDLYNSPTLAIANAALAMDEERELEQEILQEQVEISARLEKDALLQKTQQLLKQRAAFRAKNTQPTLKEPSDCILIEDSDDDSSDNIAIASSQETGGGTQNSKDSPYILLDDDDDDSYVALRVRVNGNKFETIDTKASQPLGHLLACFCNRHKVGSSGLKMVLDGRKVDATKTAVDLDLSSGDLLEATVDYSHHQHAPVTFSDFAHYGKATRARRERQVVLRLQVPGKETESVKIADSVPLIKVFRTISERHGVDIDNISLSCNGDEIMPDFTAAYYDLEDCSTIAVQFLEAEDASLLDDDLVPEPMTSGKQLILHLRKQGQDNYEKVAIAESADVAELIKKYCSKHHYRAEDVIFKIDGQKMLPHMKLASFDLESEDLIDVYVFGNSANVKLLRLILQDGDRREKYNISPDQLVSKLLTAHCKRFDLPEDKVVLKCDGEMMNPTSTIEDYDPFDDLQIDVIRKK